MPKIIFETADGQRIEVDGRNGESVMLAALIGQVPGIEAECGGACSCGTCHVHVDRAWQATVGPPGELEAGMLEMVDNAAEASRLCCQVKLTDTLDGLVVRVPGGAGE
ncbi:MAG: 2Fe-2S iron-sulfur cluster-binding protein [Caulobacteraceae bacterium]